MAREGLSRIREAFAAGDDPYEHVELDTATRLAGAMLVATMLFALVAVVVSPPSGPLGWPGVVALLVTAPVLGVALIRRDAPLSPTALLVGVLLSLLGAAFYRAAAGPDAPTAQVLFVVVVFGCMVHPPINPAVNAER